MGNCSGDYLHAYQGDFITTAPGQTPPGMFFLLSKIKEYIYE